MFTVNNWNPRAVGEICSKLTIKTPERRYWRHSSGFICNLEQVSHIVLVFPLLTLNKPTIQRFLSMFFSWHRTLLRGHFHNGLNSLQGSNVFKSKVFRFPESTMCFYWASFAEPSKWFFMWKITYVVSLMDLTRLGDL